MFQGRVTQVIAATALALSVSAAADSDVQAVPGEYVVKLKSTHSVMEIQQLSQSLGVEVVEKLSPASNAVLVRKSSMEREDFAVQSLISHPMVVNAEPNYIYSINGGVQSLPNDPMLGQLWGLINTGSNLNNRVAGREGVDVDVQRGWELNTGSRDVVIAVIDTGVDHTIADLAPNMWTNDIELNGQAGVDDDGNGLIDDIYGYDFANGDGDPMDDHGHGSHCSGTIGAKGNDGKGIVGVAWDVRIMGIKFLTGSGSGTLANAIKSIDYATQMGAHVMSNSWGGGGFSQELKDSIERARDAGILFTAAAGNSSSNNDQNPSYPASYDVDNIISVAAIDSNGRLASFSSYGKNSVHVAAPGVGILSTTPNGYKSWSGTSMATPHVSGVAALVMSHVPGISMADLRRRIVERTTPMSTIRNKVISGGIVSAYHAMTDTPAPANPNDPFNWDKSAHNISTSHPYADATTQEWTVNVPGASRISVYFSRFETERGYDKVEFLNGNMEVVGEMSGSFDDSFSPVFEGETITIRFTSDSSVNKYGFDVQAIAYQ